MKRGLRMGKEIEKKYLLPAFPSKELDNQEISLISTYTIYQTYLAYSSDQEIRIRKLVDRDGKAEFTHTFKSGHGMVREEIEYSITEPIYEQLLQNTKFLPLEKVRTTVQYGSHLFEIDEYRQIDLTVIEVEFPDVAAAERFVPPSWFGRELGAEEEYRNKTLWIKLQLPQN